LVTNVCYGINIVTKYIKITKILLSISFVGNFFYKTDLKNIRPITKLIDKEHVREPN